LILTPIDVLCLAIFVGMVALEGYRGIIPALVDFLCLLGVAFAVRSLYVPLSPHVGQPSTAFLLLACVFLGLTAVLSIFVSRRLEVHITALEATVGAVLGLFSAAVLSFTMFEWLGIRYGANASILKDSVLAWQLHEFAGLHAFMDFLRTLQGK